MQNRLVEGMMIRSLALLCSMLLILGASLDGLLQHRLADSARETGQVLARQTAGSAARMTLANDLLGMNVLLNDLLSSPQVRSAHIFSVDNRLLASAGPAPLLPLHDRPEASIGPRTLSPVLVVGISLQNELAGYLQLHWDGAEEQRTLAQFRAAYATGALLLVLICMGLVFRHALLLRHTLQKAGKALQPAQEAAKAGGEPEDLQGLLQLSEHILELRSHNSETAALPSSICCSLLVIEPADLRAVLEAFEPEQVNRQLRRAYQLVRRCADLHHARLVRVENNRVFIAFVQQEVEPAHMDALRSGRLFLMALDALGAQHSERGNPPIRFRAVVMAPEHPVMPHSLHSEAGAPLDEDLQQQACLGSRLLQQAEAGELLISEDALHAADELGETLALGEARKVEMRGRDIPIRLYPLLGLPPGQQILLEKQQENLLS